MVLPFGDLLVTGKLTSLFDNLPVLKMVIFSKANSYLALKLPEDIGHMPTRTTNPRPVSSFSVPLPCLRGRLPA